MRRDGRTASAAIAFAALVAFGCGDPDRFLAPLPSEPREATLFDLFGALVERPAGFDLATGPGIRRTDLTREWDWAFAVVPDLSASLLAGTCLDGLPPGRAVFLPRGCFEGLAPSSGLFRSDTPFEEIVEAPADPAAYTTEAALPVDSGVTYVARSRPDPGITTLGSGCRRFAKVEILSLDPTSGSATFRYFWNPNCNLRRITAGS